MGVTKYRKGESYFWRLDTWITFPDGTKRRLKKAGIPSKDMAVALERKMQTEAFEGRFFDRMEVNNLTVEQAWENYKPVSKRKNKPGSFRRNLSLVKHLKKHLGRKRADQLTQGHIDEYRTRREEEKTWKGTPPKPGTVNREVALLKRILFYAVKRGDLKTNPLSGVEMMFEDNVRQVAIDEERFELLCEAAEPMLKPILITAYETGMRRGEILELKWNQVDLKAGTIRLAPSDTKSKKPRIIVLTDRVLEELESMPRALSGYVFFNDLTGNRWYDLKKVFDRARAAAGLKHVWFHDLRRSFITNARKRGVSESVVMKISGHRTRSVFERYNVVDEDDLREAVLRIERGRREELRVREEEKTKASSTTVSKDMVGGEG